MKIFKNIISDFAEMKVKYIFYEKYIIIYELCVSIIAYPISLLHR